MTNVQQQFHYLQEGPREQFYILKVEGEPDIYAELIERWNNLSDTDWLRADWHHDLNWRPDWEMQMQMNREALVSQLLLADRVVPRLCE